MRPEPRATLTRRRQPSGAQRERERERAAANCWRGPRRGAKCGSERRCRSAGSASARRAEGLSGPGSSVPANAIMKVLFFSVPESRLGQVAGYVRGVD
eukprot:811816-Rhodomonas_salina.1